MDVDNSVNRTIPPSFEKALDLMDRGDLEGLRAHLENHPFLVKQRLHFEDSNYFRNPALLDFVADNPIRRGTLPSNIVDVAKLLINAGAESVTAALELVCSGRVPRECGVQGPLIELLCRTGANPDVAMRSALLHGEFEAAAALLRCGAVRTLPVAAATGDTETARLLLAAATVDDRRLALAFAAQYGSTEILRLLLHAGENPACYNPPGAHSHSTPLHQAALAGHLDAVRLLIKYGARLDAVDTVYQGTPAGWAKHAGNREIEELLRMDS